MKNEAMRVVRSSGASWRNGSFTAMLTAVVLGAGGANGQPGGTIEPLPGFDPAVNFAVDVGGAYGIDSADFLKQDENGNWIPGQDGYPEIAVAGAGVDLFKYCSDPTIDHGIRIMRNTGNWSPDPLNGLEEHQRLDIPSGIRATELAFADVTGTNGPDLVLLGYDSDTQTGYLLVYKNHGDGTFDDGVNILPSMFPVSGVSLRGLVVEDLDLDGDIDIAAAASECVSGDTMVIFRNVTAPNTPPEFVTQVVSLGIATGTAPGDIVAGDFYPMAPGMPLLDLVSPNPADMSVSKITNLGVDNLGNLQFDANIGAMSLGCTPTWGFATATAGKFGADIYRDFAAVEAFEMYVCVFKGNTIGQFTTHCDDADLKNKLYTQDQDDNDILAAHGIDAGNLNGGQRLDLAVAIRTDWAGSPGARIWPSAVAVLIGRADGTFQIPNEFETYIFALEEAGAALIEIVDLNGDGFDDIVVTNHYSDTISVLINSMTVSPG